MKKFISILAIAAVAALAFVSCGKDNSNGNGDDNDKGESGIQTPKKAAAEATADDIGKVIGADGNIYADASAATAAGTTVVAKIVYVGSDNSENAPYNHGLALALTDADGGSYGYFKWRESNTDAGHIKQTENFTKESGLQYNATHNKDEYPAFKAAIANNGTAAPKACSAWFLASAYQWNKINEAGSILLIDADGFKKVNGYFYWSSSEFDAAVAWMRGSSQKRNKNEAVGFVRSCLAF